MNKGLILFIIILWGFVFSASSSKSGLFEKLNISSASLAIDIYKKLSDKKLSFEAFKYGLEGFKKLQINKLLIMIHC
jgi:hypothetical protein